jgi:HNH endonuclease
VSCRNRSGADYAPTTPRGYVHFPVIGGVGARTAHANTYTIAHGPIPKGYDVHHKNNVKNDNRPSNLEAIPCGAHGTGGNAVDVHFHAHETMGEPALRNPRRAPDVQRVDDRHPAAAGAVHAERRNRLVNRLRLMSD